MASDEFIPLTDLRAGDRVKIGTHELIVVKHTQIGAVLRFEHHTEGVEFVGNIARKQVMFAETEGKTSWLKKI